MLPIPEPFPKHAPDAVAIDGPAQELAGDHQSQTRMAQAVGAGMDIETNAALDAFKTKNG